MATTEELDRAVAAWLAAKYRRTRSEETWQGYGRIIRDFRSYLRSQGMDLDPYGGLATNATDEARRKAVSRFAEHLQRFASTSLRAGGGQVADNSYNRRLSALSSFYDFANRRDYLFCGNPVDKVDRARIQVHKASRALDIESVATAMQSIDRQSRRGARDFALLSVLLETGRRISEVLGLRYRHVTKRPDGRVELSFARLKGGKACRNVLSTGGSTAILAWLDVAYEGKPGQAEHPLWPSLGRGSKGKHRPLGRRDASNICQARLGTSNIHRLRHTFAMSMKQAGASLEEIQVALSHESIATTQVYVKALEAPENRHSDRLAAMLGLSSSVDGQ